MVDMNYDGMARYIYGARLYGGNMEDVARWMASDLGSTAPAQEDDTGLNALYQAFFAKHVSRESLQDNHARFLVSLQALRA